MLSLYMQAALSESGIKEVLIVVEARVREDHEVEVRCLRRKQGTILYHLASQDRVTEIGRVNTPTMPTAKRHLVRRMMDGKTCIY